MKSISKIRKEQLSELEDKIGYHFQKIYLLDRALTHSSYANQLGLTYIEHNERMEFLGDSVLSLVISEYLFRKFKTKQEGKLTRIRAGIVCEPSLYKCAKELDLGQYMLMGKGEEQSGGRVRVSILADAFEALIAAIYIDGGYDNAKSFIISNLSWAVESITKDIYAFDYKTRLQELVQKAHGAKIKYTITDQKGPDHNKTFYAMVSVNDKAAGRGQGRSKKEAEQEAAKDALSILGDAQ